MKVAAESKVLLACLRRAAGWTEEALDFTGVDEARFLDLLDDQRLAPWLARRADRLPGLPAEMGRELQALYYREARDAGARHAELRAIRSALEGGPPCVLLKGVALLATFYEEMAERPMWDLDLLVASEIQAREVRARLVAAGFRPVRAEGEHHHLPALRRAGGDLAVEIHLDLITPSPGAGLRDALFHSATPAASGWSPLRVPSRPALVAHHALHALSDIVDSPVLRNVFELAQLVRQLDASDQAEVVRLAGLTPYRQAMARALALANRWFGSAALAETPPPGWPECLAEWRITHVGHDHRAERLLRHLVREMGHKLNRGWSPHSVLLPITVVTEMFSRAVRARLGGNRAAARHPPPAWCSAEVDGHLLVTDPARGAVHLLQPAAAAVWRANALWARPEHRATVAALRQAGLIPGAPDPGRP